MKNLPSTLSLTDGFYVLFGAGFGAAAGPEMSGPLWGALGLFVFGRIIRIGPGPSLGKQLGDKTWAKVGMSPLAFLLHLKGEDKTKEPIGPSYIGIHRPSYLERSHDHGARISV